jgi:hypothetical protein
MTRKSRLETTNHVSTLHCTGDLFEVLWTFLLCIWISTYRAIALGEMTIYHRRDGFT